jgi:hypothetical protein
VVSETDIQCDLHIILVALVGSLWRWPANKLSLKFCPPLEEREREREQEGHPHGIELEDLDVFREASSGKSFMRF